MRDFLDVAEKFVVEWGGGGLDQFLGSAIVKLNNIHQVLETAICVSVTPNIPVLVMLSHLKINAEKNAIYITSYNLVLLSNDASPSQKITFLKQLFSGRFLRLPRLFCRWKSHQLPCSNSWSLNSIYTETGGGS